MGGKTLQGVDIAYRLRTLGWTQVALAKDLQVSHGIVNNVIHDRATCHRVALRVAELLGSSLQELWPGRYEFKPRGKRPANACDEGR